MTVTVTVLRSSSTALFCLLRSHGEKAPNKAEHNECQVDRSQSRPWQSILIKPIYIYFHSETVMVAVEIESKVNHKSNHKISVLADGSSLHAEI